MTVRDIRNHLKDIYGVEVSPDLISRVTDAVWDELEEYLAGRNITTERGGEADTGTWGWPTA